MSLLLAIRVHLSLFSLSLSIYLSIHILDLVRLVNFEVKSAERHAASSPAPSAVWHRPQTLSAAAIWNGPTACSLTRSREMTPLKQSRRVHVSRPHTSTWKEAIDSPCECEHNNPDSLDARLFPSVALAVAPAVTMDEASSLSESSVHLKLYVIIIWR